MKTLHLGMQVSQKVSNHAEQVILHNYSAHHQNNENTKDGRKIPLGNGAYRIKPQVPFGQE